jgi:hypothetical protein
MLASAALAYMILMKIYVPSLRAQLERDFELGRTRLQENVRNQMLEDEGFKARLQNEYLRGREDGAKEEVAKFRVEYRPYSIVREEYLGMKQRAELGYEMQLYYESFPIGDPTKRVTNEDVKFDQEVIDKILNNEILGFLNNTSQLMLTKGLKTTTLPIKQLVA